MAGPFGQTSNQSQTQAEGAPPDPTRAGSCALKFPGLDARLGRCLDRQPPPSLKPDRSLCSGTNKLQTSLTTTRPTPLPSPVAVLHDTRTQHSHSYRQSRSCQQERITESAPTAHLDSAKELQHNKKSSRMGRIISFKPPAYHSVSRSTSPVMDDPADSEIISVPRYMSPESPSLSPSRASNKVCHLGQTLPSE